MPRIDTTNPSERWQYRCPECDSADWRANNGLFGCRACGESLTHLKDKGSGKLFAREEFEFVGPESSWKAPYAARKRGD